MRPPPAPRLHPRCPLAAPPPAPSCPLLPPSYSPTAPCRPPPAPLLPPRTAPPLPGMLGQGQGGRGFISALPGTHLMARSCSPRLQGRGGTR